MVLARGVIYTEIMWLEIVNETAGFYTRAIIHKLEGYMIEL